MPRSRRLLPLLGLISLAAVPGCDYRTLRSTLQVAPDDAAAVQVTGRKPSMRITNDGPGELVVQFYAHTFRVGDLRRLRAGETTTEALGGDFRAELRGVAERTLVIVVAERARELTIAADEQK